MTARRPRVLVVAGTRPECLKLASVVRALRAQPSIGTQLLNSGQREVMVARTFGQLDLRCDLAAGQIAAASLSQALSALRERIRRIAQEQGSALVVSQGDTSTAYAAALETAADAVVVSRAARATSARSASARAASARSSAW